MSSFLQVVVDDAGDPLLRSRNLVFEDVAADDDDSQVLAAMEALYESLQLDTLDSTNWWVTTDDVRDRY